MRARDGDFTETEHVFTLPAIQAPVELRIVAFGARYDGHPTSLTAFKLTMR